MYREIKPDPRLAPFVRCFWFMERDYGVPGAHEVVWPDGKTELLVLADGQYEHEREPLPRDLLIGPLTKPFTLTSPGRVGLVGVRFWPWGFWPFFRMPVGRLRNHLCAYADVAGPRAGQLQESVTSTGMEAGAAMLEKHLLEAVAARTLENHPLVAPLARVILAAEGMLSVQELEDRSGVSSRHLERLFQEVVGLTPKKLSVIVRFDKARRAIFWNPDVDLIEVANQVGYYDQSHFIRDFRSHFGMTPGEFREWTQRQRATMVPAPGVGFLQSKPT